MISSQRRWDFEANDDHVDQTGPYGTCLINKEVNMTNCSYHCEDFFIRRGSIHFKVLIAYWMMAGYLADGVHSVEEAYKKGFNILHDLVYKEKILKVSDKDRGMIELDRSSTHANCRHRGICVAENFLLIDMWYLKLGRIVQVVLSEDEILSTNGKGPDQNQELSKYSVVFNPTPDSLKSLLENVYNPSVLLLRGFQELSLERDCFPLDKFETLTILEISGSTGLTTIPPHTISKLIHLQCLNLSHLPIEELTFDFFRPLKMLHWLVLRACCKLVSLDIDKCWSRCEVLDLSHCTSLRNLVSPRFMGGHQWDGKFKVLDLSYTPFDPTHLIESNEILSHLYLRGSNLEDLSPLRELNYIQVLDLSGSSCFTKLDKDLFKNMYWLLKLDLSWTQVHDLPSFSELYSLHILSLRGLELNSLETLESLSNQLVELDLTGLKISSTQEFKFDFLKSLENLQILNLSQTSVAKLPDMSKLVRLKELLLADCQHLKVVPDLQALTNLETLDLSLPNDSSSNNHQLETETEAQRLVPKSLRKLVLTNRSGIQKLFPVNILGNLEYLDLRGTDFTDCDSKLQVLQTQDRIPKPVEIHIVSAGNKFHSQQPNQTSGFDHFDDGFIKWNALISDIQKNSNSAVAQEQVEMLHNDFRYIQENFKMLKNSSNWECSEELLLELMDAATNLSVADFAVDSANFKNLLRMVVKLKLLVPPKQTNNSEAMETTQMKKKKKSPFMRSQNKEDVDITDIVKGMQGMEPDLLNSYKSLSTIQKDCLLCFSIFPYNEDRDKNTGILKSLVIRKKILIYWWVGEGFINPCHEENVDHKPSPNQNPNPDQEMMLSREIDEGRDEAIEQFSAIKGVKKPKTIEEIGKQILKTLVEKGFLEPVMKKGRESASCCIHPFVHSFVIERAKEEGFFDFDQESGKLTPRFTRSQRACLLKPQDSFPSSCKLWANYTNSPNKLKSFKTVKTLFNVNESMIDIKLEWFSKMKNLSILHLGIWRSESTDLIEVNDQKFLENLKNMRQLRLLSLQGLPTIMKLPESVCYLSNLVILDLKECNYLEELPVDIGSLKSLTHLDISNCPLIYKIPTGISLLSKLEVLRGFVITDQQVAHDTEVKNASILSRWWEKTKRCGLFRSKNNEASTFRDLLKLKRLRELSIVVNICKFPEDDDLKVFKEMKLLCKLKILWQRSICAEEDIKRQELTVGSSRWQNKLPTCWKHRQNGGAEEEREESKHLDSIEKLELWCLPYENAPYWLNPRELRNLKKLYIVGGNMRKLHGSGTDENRWNVEILRLKYLCHLDIQWCEIKMMFPHLMYLEKVQCDQLVFFPCNGGVWRSSS